MKITSDDAWKKLGEENPYYSVCADDQYIASNLNDESLKSFFESGERHVNHVLEVINKLMGKESDSFDSVLDFGCGTGRLLIPFSKVANKVTGIDVSKAMLNEAAKNISRLGINNVDLIESNSLDPIREKRFDLVHTFIVLQHIPVHVGYTIFTSLLNLICEKGAGVIHITYSNEKSTVKNKIDAFKFRYRWFAQFKNIIKGKHPNAPYMQMNNYNLNSIFRILERAGFENFHVELTNHGGFRGACFYLSRSKGILTDKLT